MNLPLPTELEKRLNEAASRRGLNPPDFVRSLLERHLSAIGQDQQVPNQATLALLEKWEREDKTDDPQELARREQEGEQLMQNLARNRLEMEGRGARKLWP